VVSAPYLPTSFKHYSHYTYHCLRKRRLKKTLPESVIQWSDPVDPSQQSPIIDALPFPSSIISFEDTIDYYITYVHASSSTTCPLLHKPLNPSIHPSHPCLVMEREREYIDTGMPSNMTHCD
jgi:hypothetical protein